MTAGCQDPIPHGWVHRTGTPIRNSTRTTALGSEPLPVLAHADHGILACHGTPTNDNQYLVEEVSEHRLVRAHPSTIEERLGDVQARVVLCGHSHQQHLIQLPNGPLILNPGSVGCPSYDDPGAEPHVSESGSPHARYAVLTIGEQVSAELIAVAYDWKAAAARAEANGRSEWAYGLRTGWFMPGPGRPSTRRPAAPSRRPVPANVHPWPWSNSCFNFGDAGSGPRNVANIASANWGCDMIPIWCPLTATMAVCCLKSSVNSYPPRAWREPWQGTVQHPAGRDGREPCNYFPDRPAKPCGQRRHSRCART